MFLKILTVAALAIFQLYVAIPTGFAFGLSPWIIFLAAVTGGLGGAFATAFLGDRIRNYFFKNKTDEQKQKKYPRLYALWTKYGVVGLGFIGSFWVGAPISLAIGISLNAQVKKLLFWCCVGVITRCIVFTLIGHFGLKLF